VENCSLRFGEASDQSCLLQSINMHGLTHVTEQSCSGIYKSFIFYVRDIQLGLVVIRVNYVHHSVFEKRKTKLSLCVVTGEEYTEEGVCRLCGIDALSQLLGTYTVYTVAIQL